MERFKAYKLAETPDRKVRAEFVDYTLDQLDPHEILVRVAYSSVNYKDALAATGKGKILRRPACVGGIDFAGTVIESSDPRFKKGDAVLTASGEYVGVSSDGGYAPYTRVKGDWIAKVPPGLSLWEAMAFGTAGYTAGIAIVRMEHNGLKPENGPVIVNGATGGVGSIFSEEIKSAFPFRWSSWGAISGPATFFWLLFWASVAATLARQWAHNLRRERDRSEVTTAAGELRTAQQRLLEADQRGDHP